jgi:hypothetical protein
MLTDVSEVRSASIRAMMDVARTSETSVDIYLTTRQYIPEDSELQASCILEHRAVSTIRIHSAHQKLLLRFKCQR